MTDVLLRMLSAATLGLALALLLRRPARGLFGAGPAFTLWLLPPVLALAPLLPQTLAPAAIGVLPALTVTPHIAANAGSGASVDWVWLLVAVWLAGAALGLVRLAWVYADLRRSAQRGSAAWLATVGAAVPALDLRRVRIHETGPAVLWALPRSLVLLPRDFPARFANAATRELVLRHELTHVRRGDAWWSLAMEVVSALLWFHPLAWFARPRFRLDQELACDATALSTLPDRRVGYARALLDSIAVRPVPALIPWLAEPQLKERIAMLTRIPPGALRRRAGFLAVAATVAGGLLVAGGQTPVRAATHADAKSPAVDISYKNRNPPRYPVEAIRKGEQGRVTLHVTVDADGNVMKVAVDPAATTAPALLQSAAIAAAADWKFLPGRKDGKPVGGVVQIPVDFSLSYPSAASSSCPAGYTYQQGAGKSFSCLAPASARASS